MDVLFCAELSEVKVIHNVLKSIAIKDFAIIRPMEEGLKITLDEMRCIEMSAYIPRNLFSSYSVADDEDNIMFKINIRTLTDILGIFGDDNTPMVKFTFKRNSSPLYIIMNHNEENITVDCEMKTMNIGDPENLCLADECNLNKIVINANIFVELLQRLDNSADDLKITFNPAFPYFTMKSTSLSGESEVSLMKNSDSVAIFECQEVKEFTYAFSNIRHLIKVMHFAEKISMSMGESGLLGIQLVITADHKQLYVEYYVTSQFMTDD